MQLKGRRWQYIGMDETREMPKEMIPVDWLTCGMLQKEKRENQRNKRRR